MSEGIGSNLGCEPLEERVQETEQMSLQPHEELELAYCNFHILYDCSAEDMPDETEFGGPYSDYMALEDLYAKCNPLDYPNQIKMKILREVMQRYAESHINEDTRENGGSSFLEEITRFETMYGHYFLNELPAEEATKYQTIKSIVSMHYEKLDPGVSSAFVHLMISMGDPDIAKKPYRDLI